MLTQQHFIKLSASLYFAVTALCLAVTTTSALPDTNSRTGTSTANHEYAYRDIYATLIPDDHPYPEGFPYRIGLLYNALIDMESNMYEQDLFITAIRLYDGNQLVQELTTQSQGLYIPEFEDFNFDGYMDIAIPLMSSNTHTFPYQYWLYNPEKQRFEEAPASLNNLPAPEIDPQHQLIYAFHVTPQTSQNIDIYRWEGNAIILQESLQSYYIPIKLGDDIMYCYNEPYYDDKTGHATDAIRLTQSSTGSLTLQFSDWDEDLQRYVQYDKNELINKMAQFCQSILIEAKTPYIRIWEPEENTLLSTQKPNTQIIAPIVIPYGNSPQECATPYYDMQEQQIQWHHNCHGPVFQQPANLPSIIT